MRSTSTLFKPAVTDDQKASAHAEIERRYKEPRNNSNPQRRIALLRMHDLENLCRASDVPDDGGSEYLTVAANHIAFIYRKADAKIAAIVAWCRRFTPLIPTDGAKLLAERIVANPRMPCADKLAWRLGLTMAKRTALGITTIGAVDMNKAQRVALRKKRDAEAARRRRAAQSTGKPRGRLSKGKPWQALGISRTTYYDRRTKMRRQHNLSVYGDDGISSGPPPQPAAPPSPTSDASGCLTSAGLPTGYFGIVSAVHRAPSSLQEGL